MSDVSDPVVNCLMAMKAQFDVEGLEADIATLDTLAYMKRSYPLLGNAMHRVAYYAQASMIDEDELTDEYRENQREDNND